MRRTVVYGSAATLLPRCEEVVFAESAHMMLYEQPDAVTAALLDFLARH